MLLTEPVFVMRGLTASNLSATDELLLSISKPPFITCPLKFWNEFSLPYTWRCGCKNVSYNVVCTKTHESNDKKINDR